MTDGTKQCERCDQIAVFGNRYCSNCRKAVIKELDEAGLLERRTFHGTSRTRDHMQARASDEDNPWNQNAIRHLEGD